MPVYAIKCSACHYDKPQWLKEDFGSKVIPCPACSKLTTARKIKTKGVVEAEADGVTGYLRYDNERNSYGSNS